MSRRRPAPDTFDSTSTTTTTTPPAGLLGGLRDHVMRRLRGARAVAAAAAETLHPLYRVEQLEPRRLLHTITGSGQLEYKDGADSSVRIAWQNLTAELIFINVPPEAT